MASEMAASAQSTDSPNDEDFFDELDEHIAPKLDDSEKFMFELPLTDGVDIENPQILRTFLSDTPPDEDEDNTNQDVSADKNFKSTMEFEIDSNSRF